MNLAAKFFAAGAVLISLIAQPAPASAQIDRVPPIDFATPCPEMTDTVYRLYAAYFLRVPDIGGFDFWVQEYASGGHNLTEMSRFFAQSPEFVQRYGSLDDQQFIELVYANVLGRAPDREGFFYWLDELEAGRIDRGGLMAFFSESPEFVQLTGTITPLAGFLNAYPPGVTWSCGRGPAVTRSGTARFHDVYLLNVGANTQTASVTLLEANGAVAGTGSWSLPRQHEVYVAEFNSGGFVDRVEFDVGADVVWIHVNYAILIGQDRMGWNLRTTGPGSLTLSP